MTASTFAITLVSFSFIAPIVVAFLIHAYRATSFLTLQIALHKTIMRIDAYTSDLSVANGASRLRIACHVVRFKVATYAIRAATVTLRTLNSCKRAYRRALQACDRLEVTIGTTEDQALALATVKIDRARLTVHNVLTGILLGIDTARDNVKISRNN